MADQYQRQKQYATVIRHGDLNPLRMHATTVIKDPSVESFQSSQRSTVDTDENMYSYDQSPGLQQYRKGPYMYKGGSPGQYPPMYTSTTLEKRSGGGLRGRLGRLLGTKKSKSKGADRPGTSSTAYTKSRASEPPSINAVPSLVPGNSSSSTESPKELRHRPSNVQRPGTSYAESRQPILSFTGGGKTSKHEWNSTASVSASLQYRLILLIHYRVLSL